jgi:hypothetical protein
MVDKKSLSTTEIDEDDLFGESTTTPVQPAKPATSVASRPAADAELTPDQLRIRDLENRLALSEGKKDVEPVLVKPGSGSDNILIHFLEDGLTALGVVWMRGQELEFTPGSQPYEDTKDRHGVSWLSLVDDDFAQVEKYGKVMFRRGPWPGKSYGDAKFEALRSLSGDGRVAMTDADLAAAESAERQRGRAAPVLPNR